MRLSEAVTQRVLDAATELNYRPNALARSLRTNTTRTIAFISNSIVTDHYSGGMVHGAMSAAHDKEHLLLIAETGGDAATESELIREFLDRRVDGFVYASAFTRAVTVPEELAYQNLVLLNCVAVNHQPGWHSVLPNEREAGQRAATFLYEHGHRHVQVVGEVLPSVFAATERFAGITDAVRSLGIRMDPAIGCSWWPDHSRQAVAAALSGGNEMPTALICMNDRVAFGVYQAVGVLGLRIPDDISVVSFDDSELASWLEPTLTSIGIGHRGLGAAAVDAILPALEGPTATTASNGVKVSLTMPMAARASVAPPRSRCRSVASGADPAP